MYSVAGLVGTNCVDLWASLIFSLNTCDGAFGPPERRSMRAPCNDDVKNSGPAYCEAIYKEIQKLEPEQIQLIPYEEGNLRTVMNRPRVKDIGMEVFGMNIMMERTTTTTTTTLKDILDIAAQFRYLGKGWCRNGNIAIEYKAIYVKKYEECRDKAYFDSKVMGYSTQSTGKIECRIYGPNLEHADSKTPPWTHFIKRGSLPDNADGTSNTHCYLKK